MFQASTHNAQGRFQHREGWPELMGVGSHVLGLLPSLIELSHIHLDPEDYLGNISQTITNSVEGPLILQNRLYNAPPNLCQDLI